MFGETVTNNVARDSLDLPDACCLLAATRDLIATVFRQVAMNRFE